MSEIYKVRKTDCIHEMTYEDVCKELGFYPDVGFVEITKSGTITFTLGKPHEIRALYRSVIENGFIPANRMKTALR